MGAWAGALALAGQLLGQNYQKVERYVRPMSKIVIGVIVVVSVVFIVLRKRKQLSDNLERRA